jgi:hypothetical protein
MTIRIIPDFIPAGSLTVKVCSRCGDKKPHSEFFAQKRRSDGKHPWCKGCCRERNRERKDEINTKVRERWRSDQEFRERRCRDGSEWRQRNLPHKRAYERKRRKENPEEYKARAEAYRTQNTERTRMSGRGIARVQYAIKKGWLTRPSTCEWCGTEGKIEAAHRDYSKPLDVTWLCRSCHTKWDHYDPKTKGVAM